MVAGQHQSQREMLPYPEFGQFAQHPQRARNHFMHVLDDQERCLSRCCLLLHEYLEHVE